MTERTITDLVSQVTSSILIANRDGANITPERAKERANSIVAIVLPLLEERERDVVERIRSIAGAMLSLGEAHRAIENGADTAQRELEALLAGIGCEVCGREIRANEGAFEVAPLPHGAAGKIVITCGRCDEPKKKASKS